MNEEVTFDLSNIESCKYTIVVFQDPAVKEGLYSVPQFIPGTTEEAIGSHVRQQVRACEKGQIPKHNVGLIEFAIGTFDDATGKIELYEKPVKLLRLYSPNEGNDC